MQNMTDLIHTFPDDNLHVADLPYRFSSWALDVAENGQLWLDDTGNVRAWAVMQTPFWTIDYACHPDFERELHPQILAWADQRAQQAVGTAAGRPIWFANVFVEQTARIRELETAGFASQADVGANSWTKVLMRHASPAAHTVSPPPAGFTIRPLAGASEVDAYVDLHRAAFESNSMTRDWRARTLQQPAYAPDLDLVAVAPDGRLVGFCIGWLCTATSPVRGQIEPLGVHPDFHGLGLGRALLTETVRRLFAHGAQAVYVETDNYRDAAFALYESVGFRVLHDVLVFRKDYAHEG